MRPAWRIEQVQSLAGVRSDEWNAIAGVDNPFLSHAFLAGLEIHGCLADHGWQSCHVLVRDGAQLIGALPLYLRGNSHGEFVFDWSWAEALERAGGRYYPKLVTAIPFTPVRGPRFLVHPRAAEPDVVRRLLLEYALAFARDNGLSSWHCLFPDTEDAEWLSARTELLPRCTCQFHWRNRGYEDFEAYLGALDAKRRKQIRRERREVAGSGVEIVRLGGADVTPQLWQVFHRFYRSTFERRWGEPRLTLPFFRSLSGTLADRTLLILARDRGEWIAGAFAMVGSDTVYGRHWGCSRTVPFLHFELCYYQTIEYCIQRRLRSVDAGVQGEHKVPRGFEPEAALSFHWLRDPGFHAAVQTYLEHERAHVTRYVGELRAHLPYRAACAAR
jgi:hypothetical protein